MMINERKLEFYLLPKLFSIVTSFNKFFCFFVALRFLYVFFFSLSLTKTVCRALASGCQQISCWVTLKQIKDHRVNSTQQETANGVMTSCQNVLKSLCDYNQSFMKLFNLNLTLPAFAHYNFVNFSSPSK